MKSDKQNLVHDLLDERPNARREAALTAGGRALRRRRWRRSAWQCLAAVALLGTAVVSLHKSSRPPLPAMSLIPAPAKPEGSLSDKELLALFPDTPVGLATMADGKKRLVFPRPGDEEKFVTHL